MDLNPSNDSDSPITPIKNPNLICEDHGVMIAIRSEINNEKVWQSDPGYTDGIELTIHKFDRARCPHTFSILASMTIMSQSAMLKFETQSNCSERNDVVLNIYSPEELVKTVPCRVINP